MTDPKRHLLCNLHVYFVGPDFYVPTVVRWADGPWVETLPVFKGKTADLDGLVNAILGAKQSSGMIPENRPTWDSEGGRVWATASQIWSLHWYDDSTLLVIPKRRVPTETDPETGGGLDGGWADDIQKAHLLPADTGPKHIVQLLVS